MRLFVLKVNNMKQITLNLEGMHCGMCESHVCDQIRKSIPGATKVKADHRKGIAIFVVDDGIDYHMAITAISNEGYKVLSSNEEEYQKKKLFSFLRK